MPDSYTVRYAKEDDISSLQEVDPWPKERDWRHKISASEVVVAMEESTSSITGHLRFDVMWSTVPFLALIFVSPDYRGRGLSRQLLDFLEAELKGRGYVALLSSSQTDELGAQRWHVHMGFHTNGIIENIADDNVGDCLQKDALKVSTARTFFSIRNQYAHTAPPKSAKA